MIFVVALVVHDIIPHYFDVFAPISPRLLVEQAQGVTNFMSYNAPLTAAQP
jgi:hypothetical protein